MVAENASRVETNVLAPFFFLLNCMCTPWYSNIVARLCALHGTIVKKTVCFKIKPSYPVERKTSKKQQRTLCFPAKMHSIKYVNKHRK
jgi:hypothetical protein